MRDVQVIVSQALGGNNDLGVQSSIFCVKSFGAIMPEWLTFIIELFRSGQGVPFLAVSIVGILSLYFFGLILTMVFPVWRRYRNPHQ